MVVTPNSLLLTTERFSSIDSAGNKVVVNSSSFAHSILDTNNSSNSHSFFSTGPLPAYTARSNGTSPSGCKSNDKYSHS